MRISDHNIEEIRAAMDIVEVVEDFVPLKKKGQNWWALSPFTNEKTPSFSVSPAKGIFKCFSTGKGGDSITFVMEMEGIGYVEALKYLAKKYNIELEQKEMTDAQKEAHSIRESLFIALNFAKTHFQEQLTKTEAGKAIGLSYFKQRGFNTKIIEEFELGYSQDEWRNFEDAALKNGFSKEVLEQAGLVVAKEDGKRYDRFRGRVMFPIHNLSGRTIGFGARTLKKDKMAKYLNSPESDVYHKSDVLYGLFQAKKAIRNEDNCYLVEGYTDVISLYQNGVENVVSSSGTSLTEGQISLIKRFTENVTVLYDGDSAGIKASLRGVDMLLSQGLNVQVVRFPDGEDPDSYVQKIGGSEFRKYLKETSKDFILFKTDLQLADTQGSPLKRAEAVRSIVESIAKIPDPIKRTVFCEECSRVLNIEVGILVDEVNKIILSDREKAFKQNQRAEKRAREQAQKNYDSTKFTPTDDFEAGFTFSEEDEDFGQFNESFTNGEVAQKFEEAEAVAPVTQIDESILFQEKESVRILLEYGSQEVEEGKKLAEYWLEESQGVTFHSPNYKRIMEMYLAEMENGKCPTTYELIAKSEPAIQAEIIGLTTERGLISEHWMGRHEIFIPPKDHNLEDIVFKNLCRMKFRLVQKIRKQAMEKIKVAESENELTKQMKIYQELKSQENDLAKILGVNYS
ncbi:MAG: DNA primase [Flammeovirgaceae bacterium]